MGSAVNPLSSVHGTWNGIPGSRLPESASARNRHSDLVGNAMPDLNDLG